MNTPILTYYGSTPEILFSGDLGKALFNLTSKLSLSGKKIGIINWFTLNINSSKVENIEQFVKNCDMCFFVSEEILDLYIRSDTDINKLFAMLNKHNVFYLMYDKKNNLIYEPSEKKTLYLPWFLKSKVYIPKNFIPDMEYKEKQYKFNLLLGSKKCYRTKLYEELATTPAIYSTYFGHVKYKHTSNTHLDEPDVLNYLITQDIENHKLDTIAPISNEDGSYYISHTIPSEIYKNTHFDIVAETLDTENTWFTSEKTAKPLATGRFFIWYNSENINGYLKNYNFVLDDYLIEDFDSIVDKSKRLETVIGVVKNVSVDETLVKHIYKKTKNARIHNMEVYRSHINNFENKITQWVHDCVINK